MGQGLSAVAVAAASYLVAVAAPTTWLGSPPIKYILLAGASLDVSRKWDLSSCYRHVRWPYQTPSDPGGLNGSGTVAAVEGPSRSRTQLNFWHEVHLLEHRVNVSG